MTTRVGIIGGGLGGLVAARLLEQRGCEYVLLEARDRLGGRLLTESSAPGEGHRRGGAFDLGATWIWPEVQPELRRLIEDLGLLLIPQHEAGDMLIEGAQGALQRFARFVGPPPSMRVAGGMGAVVEALRQRLAPGRLLQGHRVESVRMTADGAEIHAIAPTGRRLAASVDHVLLAVPPRLAVGSIRFEPGLPFDLARAWDRTATWMAPHAKYMAVYPRPFWRERGLSGDVRSHRGPLSETHDASVPDGPAALFGFLGVTAPHRGRVSEDELRALCRKQLVRLFGPDAASPTAEWIKDWAADPFTATAHDRGPGHAHAHASMTSASDGPWQGRLTGVASEWSLEHPGVMAGALDAAVRGVREVIDDASPMRLARSNI